MMICILHIKLKLPNIMAKTLHIMVHIHNIKTLEKFCNVTNTSYHEINTRIILNFHLIIYDKVFPFAILFLMNGCYVLMTCYREICLYTCAHYLKNIFLFSVHRLLFVLILYFTRRIYKIYSHS